MIKWTVVSTVGAMGAQSYISGQWMHFVWDKNEGEWNGHRSYNDGSHKREQYIRVSEDIAKMHMAYLPDKERE